MVPIYRVNLCQRLYASTSIHLLDAQVGSLFLLGHLARDAIETGDLRSPISHLSNLHQIIFLQFQLS
ncbi:hypothetical protein VNO80_29365 [Phaseolus coccineus]|uniref:Uncharacterized protein n=1 Tax=Phaseolus coccineus TaxID=3886 RepID=A0AAN9LBB1_PHACN